MKWRLTDTAEASYNAAQPAVQKAFDKQVGLLSQNLLHPSLRAKKFDESSKLWQARVNQGWRFYFTIEKRLRHPQDHPASEVAFVVRTKTPKTAEAEA